MALCHRAVSQSDGRKPTSSSLLLSQRAAGAARLAALLAPSLCKDRASCCLTALLGCRELRSAAHCVVLWEAARPHTAPRGSDSRVRVLLSYFILSTNSALKTLQVCRQYCTTNHGKSWILFFFPLLYYKPEIPERNSGSKHGDLLIPLPWQSTEF